MPNAHPARALATLLLAGALAATLAATLRALHPILDLAAHWRAAYALAAALALPVFVLGSGRASRASRAAALTALALVALNLAPLRGRLLPVGIVDRDAAPSLDLLLFNVLGDNARHAQLAEHLAASDADLLLLLELRPPLADHLDRALEGYEIVARQPRDDNFGIGLLARRDLAPGVESRASDHRLRLVTAHIRPLEPGGDPTRPAITAHLLLDGRPLTLLGVHLQPPTTPAGSRRRARELRALAAEVAASDRPVVLAGDLNTTPWGADWPLLAPAGLLDAGAGRGLAGTWPAPLPAPLRIPLDHVLHDPALATTDHAVGPALGSDHRAVRARLRWREAPPLD